jgi:hypothetical protein
LPLIKNIKPKGIFLKSKSSLTSTTQDKLDKQIQRAIIKVKKIKLASHHEIKKIDGSASVLKGYP